MSDFHYDIKEISHYYIDDITVYGKSVQDGTPTPDNPIPVQVVEGENLYDIETYPLTNNRYIISTSGNDASSSSGNAATLDYIPCSNFAGMQVTLNRSPVGTGTTPGFAFYDSSKAYISGVKSNGSTQGQPWTITVPANAVYMRFTSQNNANDVMLNIGDSPLPYTPYGVIYVNIGDMVMPLDLQRNMLASLPDGTKDELSIDSTGAVTLTKRVGKYTITGTESYGSDGQYGSYYRIIINPPLSGAAEAVTRVNSTGYCTHAPYVPNASQQSVHVYANSGTIGLFALGTTAEEVQTAYTGAIVYYKLLNEQTINLNPIDLPSDGNEPYTVSVTASLTPETDINQTNKPTYEVENPYEHIPGEEMQIPPVHPMMQEWETFDPDNWDEQTMMGYTYQNEWHAVYTVYLGELMQSGVFDWSRPELNWRDAAIDDEQYKRVCDYFNLRFKWREISMLPVLKWFDYLHSKLVYELMPKYKPLYERVAEGVNPLSSESEYYKNRTIQSAYPETLLSENSDYITDGKDEEFQRIKEHGTADAIVNFAEVYKAVDQLLLDELEVMFVSLYTTNINGL